MQKSHHLWSGPFKVLKRISDSTYRIQQLEGRKYKKIVHFDRLKLCPNNIRLEDSGARGELPSHDPANSNAIPLPSVPEHVLPIGHNLELLGRMTDQLCQHKPISSMMFHCQHQSSYSQEGIQGETTICPTDMTLCLCITFCIRSYRFKKRG